MEMIWNFMIILKKVIWWSMYYFLYLLFTYLLSLDVMPLKNSALKKCIGDELEFVDHIDSTKIAITKSMNINGDMNINMDSVFVSLFPSLTIVLISVLVCETSLHKGWLIKTTVISICIMTLIQKLNLKAEWILCHL